jgi:hypothetical protein
MFYTHEKTVRLEENFAFLILCPDLNTGGLRTTVSSIKSSHPETPYLCVTGDHANAQDVEELNRVCPVIKAGKKFTDLINEGVKKLPREWGLVVVAGNVVRPSLLRKYSHFLTEDKEVLYAVASRSTWMFEDATINGLLVSKKAIGEVGDFPDSESLTFSKLMWSAAASKKGYKLKGLVGVKL